MDSSWFRDAAFGAFIHWGLYAVPGGIWNGKETDYIGEWLQARLRIPRAEYSKLTAQFNPVKFNADEWCRRFAEAGMKYIVFTAKHHEGFSMFRTQVSPYNIVTGTPFGRDPLSELAEACRKHGLKFGIYYSHCLDWYEKDAAAPDRNGSTNIDGSSWGNDWDFPDPAEKKFERYFRSKVIPQLKELLTRYGPVSVLWFDCATGITKEQCEELRELVHGLQPDCLINGRIGFGCQDYMSLGDNQMPGNAIPGLVECPATLNDTWGFKWHDHNWKTPEQIVELLLSLAEHKVNLLLNVGPRPDGEFTQETIDILHQVGLWRKTVGDLICSASGTPFRQHIDGVFVLRNGTCLLFFPGKGAGKMTFSGIRAKAVSAPVPFTQTGRALTVDFSKVSGMYPCIKVRFDAVPEVDPALMPQNGILFLAPSAGRIIEGKDTLGNEVNATDTDGKILHISAHMALTGDGQLCSWHNPSDLIEWTAELTEPGIYEVLLTSRSMQHSHPWTGKRIVEVKIGETCLTGELTPAEPPQNIYYPCADSLLGTVEVDLPRPVTVSLRTKQLFDDEAQLMACCGVTLRKIH